MVETEEIETGFFEEVWARNVAPDPYTIRCMMVVRARHVAGSKTYQKCQGENQRTGLDLWRVLDFLESTYGFAA